MKKQLLLAASAILIAHNSFAMQPLEDDVDLQRAIQLSAMEADMRAIQDAQDEEVLIEQVKHLSFEEEHNRVVEQRRKEATNYRMILAGLFRHAGLPGLPEVTADIQPLLVSVCSRLDEAEILALVSAFSALEALENHHQAHHHAPSSPVASAPAAAPVATTVAAPVPAMSPKEAKMAALATKLPESVKMDSKCPICLESISKALEANLNHGISLTTCCKQFICTECAETVYKRARDFAMQDSVYHFQHEVENGLPFNPERHAVRTTCPLCRGTLTTKNIQH